MTYRKHEIALVALIILALGWFMAMAIARPVAQEDECIEGTLAVKRIAGVLWCIGE